MIGLVIVYFISMSLICALLFSAQLRDYIWQWLRNLLPRLSAYASHASKKIAATTTAKINTIPNDSQRWDPQQVLILLAGMFLITAPVLWMATRDVSSPILDDDIQSVTDPQIYALLEGEMLVPPPEVDTELIVAAEAIARQAEQISLPNTLPSTAPSTPIVTSIHTTDLRSANRKWDKMNPRYVQRLLLVFKIMKERHGYDMVLLEGYRSPERQNRLAGQGSHVTKATGYRSYHQFGLAADVAFMRNGKVVITEKDPWAMQGYKYYGEVAESVGLTWGGRWKMMDLGHTEFRMKGILGKPEIAAKLTSEKWLPSSTESSTVLN